MNERRQRTCVMSWLLLSFLCLSAWSVRALDPQKRVSQFIHTAWTAKDGIPNPVRAIAQTPDGYLWLGTAAGLYRFNGLAFEAWRPPSAQHLSGNVVCALHVTHDGALWIGYCSGGIDVLRDGQLLAYSPGQGLPEGAIRSIAEDHDGRVWVAGQYGLVRQEKGHWLRVGEEMGYSAPGAQSLLVDASGNLWAATDGFDFRLSRDRVLRNTVLELVPGAKRFVPTGLASGQVFSMGDGPSGSAWMADTSNGAITRLSSAAGHLPKRINLSVESPLCFLFDSPETVWVGLYKGGLRRVTSFTGAGKSIPDAYDRPEGLTAPFVYSAFRDREGNLWFGTAEGLDRFRESKVFSYSQREGLTYDNEVGLTADASGSLWLYQFSTPVIGRFGENRFTPARLPRNAGSTIVSFYGARNHDVWAGGHGRLFRGVRGEFSPFPLPFGANDGFVDAISEDLAGNLWIALWTSDSIEKIYRDHDGKWEQMTSPVLRNFRCQRLFGDTAGRMWVAFGNGDVALFDAGQFHLFSVKDGLSGQRVRAVGSDRTGYVWLSSQGGFSRFDGRRFTTLSSDNGLPSSSITGFEQDEEGAFWIAGGLGILRVTAEELNRALRSPTYRMQGLLLSASNGLRGLPNGGSAVNAVARTGDGKIWFSTTEGITGIDPEHIPVNEAPPPVKVESVIADDHLYAASEGLKVPARTKTLEFHFSDLSLTDPDLNRFRFKLEGYDEDWHGPVREGVARYTNLPPRHYRLRVMACNNDGVWNEEGGSLSFAIPPSFTQTRWFTLLCVFAVIGLTAIAYQIRVRHLTAKLKERLFERMDERQRIARDLHDTFLQDVQALVLRFSTATRQLAFGDPVRAQLEATLDRSDIVLLDGRNLITSLHAFGNPWDDLLDSLRSFAEGLHSMYPETEFESDIQGGPMEISAAVGQEAPSLLREALTNAFRHAQARHVWLTLSYLREGLRIEVRDDGRGIDKDVLTRGSRAGHWGMKNMKERAERIGARYQLTSSPGTGTTVEVFIPARLAYVQARGGLAGWLRSLLC